MNVNQQREWGRRSIPGRPESAKAWKREGAWPARRALSQGYVLLMRGDEA